MQTQSVDIICVPFLIEAARRCEHGATNTCVQKLVRRNRYDILYTKAMFSYQCD